MFLQTQWTYVSVIRVSVVLRVAQSCVLHSFLNTVIVPVIAIYKKPSGTDINTLLGRVQYEFYWFLLPLKPAMYSLCSECLVLGNLYLINV